jgi:RNA polymerase sigma-70 factor (ECF subfamily)
MTGEGNRDFPSTSWTLIVAAAGPRPDASVRHALEKLCRAYWYPLYAYARRQAYPAEDAADLVQGYFAKLLEKDYLQDARSERGRFRSFLIASFRHYLSNERDRERAVKRGGSGVRLSISVEDAERVYSLDPARDPSPDKVFERQWALTVLERAMSRLRSDSERRNKARVFDMVKGYLMNGGDDLRYAEQAAQLNMSTGALKVEVHRMRKRLQGAVRDEIAETVRSSDDIEEELRFLIAAIS